MAHTPGPWHVAEGLNRYPLVFGQKPDDYLVADCVSYRRTPAQAEANARLIAAAPELLAALKGMIDAYWRGSEDSDDEHAPSMVKAALAAIAKAEGVAP